MGSYMCVNKMWVFIYCDVTLLCVYFPKASKLCLKLLSLYLLDVAVPGQFVEVYTTYAPLLEKERETVARKLSSCFVSASLS